jgi:predicted tellurium resistance membrane protein TerC
VIGLLILNYARILYGFKTAFAIVTAYLFYLGITSIAALLPTYTGLILTVEGVVLMGIIMQVLSQHKELKIGSLFQSSQNLKTAEQDVEST